MIKLETPVDFKIILIEHTGGRPCSSYNYLQTRPKERSEKGILYKYFDIRKGRVGCIFVIAKFIVLCSKCRNKLQNNFL